MLCYIDYNVVEEFFKSLKVFNIKNFFKVVRICIRLIPKFTIVSAIFIVLCLQKTLNSLKT